MYAAVEFVAAREGAVVGLVDVEPEDGAAEAAHPCEFVHVVHDEVERLVSAPREAGHGAVLTIGEGAEMAVDVGDEVADHYLVERAAVLAAVASAEGCLDVAALHHDNHRHSLAAGYQVVHDVLHVALTAPARLVLTHAVLQVKDGILFLAPLVLGRRVNHRMTPLTGALCKVIDAAYLTCRDVSLRTVVVTF